MKVLSLFDGMACGMLAMQKAGIEVDRYVAFEIDKYAVQTSSHNFPMIEHRGDVFQVDFTEFSGFDFLVGGSPCTYWSIAQKNRTSLVLGADTVVVCDNLVFGKPGSETEAFSMLKALSGREHSVITGVALCCEKDSICEQFKVTTKVRFKSLDDEAIRSYMQCVPVMDKAGAYAIQDHGDMLLEKISGSFSNVIGLPVEELSCHLEKYS